MSFVASGTLLTGAAFGGGIWGGMAAGAAWGAGVGQLTGGNTKSTLTGMGIGAATGGVMGGMGSAASGGMSGDAIGMSPSMMGGGNFSAAGAMPGAGAGAIGGGTVAGAGAGGANWGTALMLGSAGMGLAQAFSSQGQTPTQKIELSKQGKEFEQETLLPAVKEQYAKALKGNVSDKAFGAISTAKTQESVRARGSQSILAKAQAEMGNRQDIDRGGAASGGSFVKSQIADAGERMSGLFAPTSILNNFRKEELMNSVNQIQNVQNRENVVGQMAYSGNLAAWNANQQASAQKGAALGGVAQMIGTTAYTNANIAAYKQAMA